MVRPMLLRRCQVLGLFMNNYDVALVVLPTGGSFAVCGPWTKAL